MGFQRNGNLVGEPRRYVAIFIRYPRANTFPWATTARRAKTLRLWGDPPYVTRDLLLGRGLFLYWPHSWNSPFFGFPDFSRMKFIR